MVPMGAYPTADGHLNVAAMGDYARFCELVGGWPRSPTTSYATFASRVERRAALDDDLTRTLRTRTTAEWVERLADVVPCGPVLAVDEVFADPQVEHLGLTERVEHPTRGEVDVLRPPLTFSETPARIRTGPPANDADTATSWPNSGTTRRRSTPCTERCSGNPRTGAGMTTTAPDPVDTGTERMLAHVEGGIGWMTYNNRQLNRCRTTCRSRSSTSWVRSPPIPRCTSWWCAAPATAPSCRAPTSRSSRRSAPRSPHGPTTTR